jgi:two-component system chemotaxis sensor kinase CheA
MPQKENDFQKRLLATFKAEAAEHLTLLSSKLLELEKATASEKQAEIIEIVFREAHSLKGAARAVNKADIESVCQALEGTLAALKRRELTLSPALFDVLHHTVDGVVKLLSTVEAEKSPVEKNQIFEMVRQLQNASKGILSPLAQDVSKTEHAARTAAEPADTVRVRTAKLDSLFLQAEELIPAKLVLAQRSTEARDLKSSLSNWKKQWAKVEPKARNLRRRIEGKNGGSANGPYPVQAAVITEFLDWNQAYFKSMENRLNKMALLLEQDQRNIGRTVDGLIEDTKRVLMLPFSSLLEIFPRLVRELSRDQGKEVELLVTGGEVEIDRRILEEMKDPLLHLLRNCIDHGIEKPDERKKSKKGLPGKISIALSHKNGNKVEIAISDDGAGIDLQKVRSAAIKLGLLSGETAGRLSQPELLPLVFESGITTSPIITDISGRGLGLAIVREKVEKLGGTISAQTRVNAGTTFRIVLPLTLTTFRGVLVRVAEQLFVLPTANVERATRVSQTGIKTVENRDTIQVNKRTVPIVRLADVLGLSKKVAGGRSETSLQAIILGSAEKQIALVVDEVLTEQEVLVKSLGKQLTRVRNIAGATILGTGRVVPILNVPDLMKSAIAGRFMAVQAGVVEETKEKRKKILVVEDSITARTLLKNVLEAGGYDVKTSVDGIDAYTKLREEDFDLVVSDIDMPRMNGLDLTAKIRADKKLSELPVVLVTALETREDRERGIDVGANAYLVKSSFDQSNLMEVIRRLI